MKVAQKAYRSSAKRRYLKLRPHVPRVSCTRRADGTHTANIAERLKLPITATPLIAERAVFQCDVGSPVTHLRRDFPHVDFLNLYEETWWHPGNEDLASLNQRCVQFREQCKDRIGDKSIFVTHWGFIRSLTNIRAQNCGVVAFDPKTAHPGGGTVVYSCNPC